MRFAPPSPSGPGFTRQLEWSATLRDIMPTLHPTTPYAVDASPYIIAESGPNFKHALKAAASMNGEYMFPDRYAPHTGLDGAVSAELAGPPGEIPARRGWEGFGARANAN